MKKEEAKQKIKLLIDKFTSQFEYYKSLNYNEMQTRQDFINPFFKALGWDIDNTKQQLETYRDVKHEDKVKINGHTKAPDYSFNIEGKRKFFVEAKKPSISIKENPEPALQVRNYGWNANLSISILMDFEELAIYNCTKKPRIIENANAKRLKYIYYTDYLKEFDFIYDTFAYENVLAGSIETYAKSKIDFKTAEPVNEEFLKSIETWRQYLATTIIANHKNIEDENINFAVQQIIDRIVFLKVCEDRKIEKENSLFKLIKSGDYYQNLYAYFQIADQKYNSGLFDFKKDTITQNLKIENKVIKNIITELYGKTKENEKEYGYNFAIIPVEILGLAYEQFLGKVVKINASKNAQIEEKPEVRKAGGVYYTPEYIVEYIVKNTLGKLIENKKPEEISKIKVLDPSCGSGSFLLGAYQYLLDYHLKYYDKNRSKLKMYNNPLTPDGSLTSQEKKRILLNNIFGVDIDTQAVEVSKLSLLLKALEGETEASIQTSLQLIHERVLPTIDNNVRSGNSLIAPDFYNEGLFLTPKEERKINVFDWKIGFADVFKQGGFDCVIGNPPYVTLQLGKKQASQKDFFLNYYKNKFTNSFDYKVNLYALFMEKSIGLLKNEGVFSYIIPNTFFNANTFKKLRKYFLSTGNFEFLFDLRYKVFEQAEIGGNALFKFIKNDKNCQTILYKAINFDSFLSPEIQIIEKNKFINNHTHNLNIDYNSIFIAEKILKLKVLPLDNFVKIYQGIITGDNKKFLTDKPKNSDKWQKIIRGRDINKYLTNFSNIYVYFEPKELWSNTNINMFKCNEKIISRQTSDKLIATYDAESYFSLDSTHVMHLKDSKYNLKYILALFNSKLLNYIYQNNVKESGRVFAQVKVVNLKQLPIKTIDFNNKTEKNQHDKLVKLVENILELNKRLQNSTIQTEKEQLQQRIEFTDIEINQLVYELYEITEQSEIDIIEQKNA
ncbi:MAG: hypothetical protein EAZ85_08000 [Bacteroidetes bacterium]|nr:MAG: hypothetical protein EAZ85_08000 [Bacteroidota bacterium]TAG87511.1 MAG: hypothetical protein EAZ20_10480 [Bacteroidota bacterium]